MDLDKYLQLTSIKDARRLLQGYDAAISDGYCYEHLVKYMDMPIFLAGYREALLNRIGSSKQDLVEFDACMAEIGGSRV